MRSNFRCLTYTPGLFSAIEKGPLCIFPEVICDTNSLDHSTQKSIDLRSLFLFYLFSKNTFFNYPEKLSKMQGNVLIKISSIDRQNNDEFLSSEM